MVVMKYRWVKTADCGKTNQNEQYRTKYLNNANTNQQEIKSMLKRRKFATFYQKTKPFYLFSA